MIPEMNRSNPEPAMSNRAGIGMAAIPSLGSCEWSPLSAVKKWMAARSCSAVVAFLCSFIIFSPLIEGGTTYVPNLVMRAVLFTAVLLCFSRQMKLGVVSISQNRLYPLLALFFGWAALTLWWAPYKNASIQWLLTLLMYIGLFAVTLEGVKSSRQIQHIVMLLLGMGLCEGLLGLVQYFFFGEPRAKGTFFNPNFFATYEVAIFALALGAVSRVQRNEARRWEHVFLWLTIIITCAAFVAAQSRGALVAFALVITFIGYLRLGKRSLIVLALIFLVGVLLPNPLKERFIEASIYDPYAYTRVDIWKSSLDRMLDHPLGSGLGMFKYTSFQYRFPIEQNIVWYGKRAESAHNEYLQMGVELGFVGLAIFALGFFMWGQDVRDILRNRLKSNDRAFSVGLAGSVLAILAHGAVDSVFHEPALVVLLVICGGLVVSFKPKDMEQGSQWNVLLSYSRTHAAGVMAFGIVLAIIMLQPAVGWYLNGRGEHEASAGRHERALEWFERASLIDPGTTGYHDAIARTSVQLFHQSNNLRWLMQAIEQEVVASALNPVDGRFPYRLGTIYALLADQKIDEKQRDTLLAHAGAAYEDAIRLDPFSAFSYLELGRIRIAQGRPEEGRDWLRKGILIEPNFLPARVLLADLSLRSGFRQEAQSSYEAILDIKKRYETRNLSTMEHQFLDVDLYPLGRALGVGAHS